VGGSSDVQFDEANDAAESGVVLCQQTYRL